MAQDPTGNVKGLAPSELRRIRKLFERRLGRDEVLSLDLAREMFRLATDLRRRIGLIISREGRVEEVAVGTKDILYIPDLGRYRLGRGRLRRLRLVFTDLSVNHGESPSIPNDIYGDLEKLRLDMVIGIKELPNRVAATYAHLVKFESESSSATATEKVKDLGSWEFDFDEFITNLEEDLSQSVEGARALVPNRALLVGVYGSDVRAPESSMAELSELCRTAGIEIAGTVIQRRTPDPKTLLGKGKLEEVVLRSLRAGAEMVVFDGELKPTQWRAVTNSTELKVLDRSMVILDIFAQRATSSDGRLQVELAQLKYNLPRLVEKDTGLSRLSGGIGGRGPGETKLEVSRRRLRDRITDLERQIDKLGEQRQLRRQRRQDQEVPLAAIIGYTNVGKSTLFNAITKSTVLVENKLFATLDPAQRRVSIPHVTEEGRVSQREFVVSDTVGFIRDLPSELMNAFRATLEELTEAYVLIHVLDASDPDIDARKASVDGVLAELGVLDVPMIIVLNKCDLVSQEKVEQLCRAYGALAVSAVKRTNLDKLLTGITDEVFGGEEADGVRSNDR